MAWASELLRLIRPSDVSRTRFSSSSNGRARSWRTASRRSGGWPRIAFSIAEQFGDAPERIFGDRRGGRLVDVVELAPRVAPAGDLDQPGLAGRLDWGS